MWNKKESTSNHGVLFFVLTVLLQVLFVENHDAFLANNHNCNGRFPFGWLVDFLK